MQVAVIAAFILAYTLVVAVFWRSAKNADHLAGRINSVAKMGSTVSEANELNRPFRERFLKPMTQGLQKRLAGMMPQTENPRLATNLKLAGVTSSAGEYNAQRMIVIFFGGLLGTAFGFMKWHTALAACICFLVGATLAMVFMRYSLTSKIKRRKFMIQKQLPEVLDLLSVSVEAGLGFDAALQRIAGRAKGALIDELDITYREITLGRPRAEALRNFEQRCGLEEIKSFVSAIIQAEQLGISLKNVLRSQAQQMRLLKKQKVEEKAMKAPVKIILPLVFFVFPVLFIILLGPAVIQIVGMKGFLG